MPPIERAWMRNSAVLWTLVTHDGDGYPRVSSPTAIRCKWEETNAEMVDPTGNRVSVDVKLAVPTQIVMGSLLWEGTLAALGESLTPEDGIYEVVMRVRSGNLKASNTRYEFGLKRYRDKIRLAV